MLFRRWPVGASLLPSMGAHAASLPSPTCSPTSGQPALCPSATLLTSVAYPQHALTVGAQRRGIKYPIVLHADSPEVSVINAREMLEQIKTKGKWKTTQHLVKVLNMAVALLQAGQYYEAKAVAEECHKLVMSLRGPTHELVAFTATTCANCCAQLATHIESELAAKRHQSMVHQDAIGPSISKALTNDRFIQKLRLDETRYREIAKRLVDSPDKWYMRSAAEREARNTAWEDSDSSRSANANFFHERARKSNEPSDDGSERYTEGWKERRKGSYHHEVRRARQKGGRTVPR